MTPMPPGESAQQDLAQYRAALKGMALPQFAGRDSRPFVVAFEGANGAGKSTLCRSLAGALGVPSCLGTDAAWFSEPFKARMIRDAEWYASAMFFLSGCFEQMRLLRGLAAPVVIMDRCLWSTLAVHAAESVARLEKLLCMLRPIAIEVQAPDLTIVLDASFATCQSRIARKAGAARALDELTAQPAFHAREQEFYRWLAKENSTLLFLDVDQAAPGHVAARALELIRQKIPC